MSASKSRAGFALLVDVAGSRDVAGFAQQRKLRLARLSRRHAERRWIQAPYTVTAWDEFQTFLWDGAALPRLILHLRQGLAPWELRVAVGFGAIEGWRRRPVNESVGGAAFGNARAAMESLKDGASKYRRLTLFRTGDAERDALLDLVYGLHDTLVQGVTERQWETIGQALEGKSQEAIAAALGVNASTVSRNLQRGHWWQMLETAEALASLLASPTPSARIRATS